MPESITSYDTYKLVFTDTFSAGLTYNNDVKVTVGGTGRLASSSLQTMMKRPAPSPSPSMTSRLWALWQTTDVKVEYTAELNTNAVVGGTGNSNNAKLSYSNNPNSDSTGTTHTDEVTVFTFEMDGTKHNSDNEGLSGAWFVLSRTNNGQIEYATVDSTNNKVTGWTVTMPTHMVDDEAVNGNITSGVDGKFAVSGLAEGTYLLTETVAPDGYNLLKDPIQIVVTATYENEELTGLTVVVGEEESAQGSTSDGKFGVDVLNLSGTELPETGGIGTTLFYVVGGALVLGAAVLLITKKRVHDAED